MKMSLKQITWLLWKNKAVIVIAPLLVALTVYILTANLSKRYESTAVILTNPNSNRGETTGGIERVDFYTSNNLFDNLTLLVKSRENLNDASLKLLALHLSIDQPAPDILSQESFIELQSHISLSLKEQLAVEGNPIETYDKLLAFHHAYPDSVVDYLIREHPHYGYQEILKNLFVARKSSSDMVEVTFKSDDPAICYYSLKYIIETFMVKYDQLKEQENINSIKYFEDQLKLSHNRLTASEIRLKEFISSHQILNYYEQGKYLDIAKLEHDQDEERAQRLASGTRSNLKEIESLFEEFGERKNLMEHIDSVQSRLVDKQMRLEGVNILNSGKKEFSQSLSKEIEELTVDLKTNTGSLVANSLSAQGIPRKSILDEWLRLKIQYEEQMQAMEVMKRRKEEINEKINTFAPLGAELNRLEREVKVNENQYLSLLNGLNLSQLRKYDQETTSSQQLIDEPIFPKKPLTSKRRFLVGGGFLGSGFLLISAFILVAFLDPTVRTAQNAEELTDIPVAGGWLKPSKNGKDAIHPLLYNRLIKQFYNQVAIYINELSPENLIVFYSIDVGEGKTFLSNIFIIELLSQGKSVSNILPESSHSDPLPGCQYIVYSEDSMDQRVWNRLLEEATGEIVIFEQPNIQQSNINFDLMNRADLNVFVMDATQAWNSSNQAYFTNVQKRLTKPQIIWLNNMDGQDLEDINGEIPKNRSRFRVFIKKILT